MTSEVQAEASTTERTDHPVVGGVEHHRSNGRCDCRSLFATWNKAVALERKRAQKLLRSGGHPFQHADRHLLTQGLLVPW